MPVRTLRAIHRVTGALRNGVLGIAILGTSLTLAVPASASTGSRVIYVDASKGSDSQSLESAQDPATPLASLDGANLWLLPGDRVVVAAGSYNLSLGDRAFNTEVVIEGPDDAVLSMDMEVVTHVRITGFRYDDAIFIHDSAEIVLSGGTSSGGVRIDGSNNVTLDDMEIHNVDDPEVAPWEKAISITDSSFVTVQNSWLHNNPEDSIQISEGSDIHVLGNLFENNGPDNATVQLDRDRHSDVMQVMAGTRIVFSGNRVVGNAHVLMIKSDFGPITDITIENSLFEGNGGYAISLHGVSGVSIRSNSYQCNGVYFEDQCGSDTQFDLLADDAEQLVRDDDPVAAGTEVPVPTTTLPQSTTSTTAQATTTVPTEAGEEGVTTSVEAAAPIDEPSGSDASAIWFLMIGGGALVGLIVALSRSKSTDQD